MTRAGWRRGGAACLWIFCLFWAFGTAWAGQKRARPNEVDEKFASMTIEELRAYQAYYYVSGGRDPMTMRMPTVAELGLEKRGQGGRLAPTLEEMEQFLANALANVIRSTKVKEYEQAVKSSEDDLRVVDEEWPPLKADPPHLLRMVNELRSFNRLAVRLKNQQDIQNEFTALRLRVDGILWSPADARAVVNGKMLAAGELLLKERKQGDLRVDLIEENGVVFLFKGMRFRIPVEVYAPRTP